MIYVDPSALRVALADAPAPAAGRGANHVLARGAGRGAGHRRRGAGGVWHGARHRARRGARYRARCELHRRGRVVQSVWPELRRLLKARQGFGRGRQLADRTGSCQCIHTYSFRMLSINHESVDRLTDR